MKRRDEETRTKARTICQNLEMITEIYHFTIFD
jgi:hypothetical protein